MLMTDMTLYNLHYLCSAFMAQNKSIEQIYLFFY
jgi:hypothetical protein